MLRHLNVSATTTVRCTCAHCTLHCTPESLIELHGQCNGDRHSAWGSIAHPRDCSRRRPLTHCVAWASAAGHPTAPQARIRQRTPWSSALGVELRISRARYLRVLARRQLRWRWSPLCWRGQPCVSFDFTSAGTMPSLIWSLYCLFRLPHHWRATDQRVLRGRGRQGRCRWTDGLVSQGVRTLALEGVTTLEAVRVASSS